MILAPLTRALGTGRERAWLLAGLAAGSAWFARNLALPGVFRGLVCCDSTDYIRMAARLDSAGDLFRYFIPPPGVSERVVGYPAFLALHRGLLGVFGFSTATAWVHASLLSSLLLHFSASIYLYRSILRLLPVHPAALFLILAHPGLTSHAALPLADSLTTSLVMLALGACARSGGGLDRRSLALAAGAGTLLGLAVLARHSLLPATILFLAAWFWTALAGRGSERARSALRPLLAAAGVAAALLPQMVACGSAFGTLCLLRPAFVEGSKMQILRWGLVSPRMYTDLRPQEKSVEHVKIDDPYLAARLGACPIEAPSPVGDFLICLRDHAENVPLFSVKKLIGLFDNFHLNTYATTVTSLPERFFNRAFGLLGFVGFAALAAALLLQRGTVFLVTLFPVLYAAGASLTNIESRYGLPAAPFAILALAALWESAPSATRVRRWILAAGAALSVLFIAQTFAWDRLDTRSQESKMNRASDTRR